MHFPYISKNAKVCLCRDTVAASSCRKILPRVVDKCQYICFVHHALALDKRRAMFQPLPICDMKTSFPLTREQQSPHESHIKKVWFAGSHSDVYVPDGCCSHFTKLGVTYSSLIYGIVVEAA